jgi:sugar phosphate isomerase/epimerase
MNGLKFFYHTHGYEFGAYGTGTLFDLLMAETKPKYVCCEMDVFWIVAPGQDPVQMLQKFGKRWQLTHLKDMKRGTPTGAGAPAIKGTDSVALGTGQIDLPGILRASNKAGVKWHFIEDESASSETQIPVSLEYLSQVRL